MPPKAVLFDYGMTLCTEPPADGLRGAAALLAHAAANPRGVTPETLLARLDAVQAALGFGGVEIRRSAETIYRQVLEQPFSAVLRYALASLDLVLDVGLWRAEVLYWDACSPGSPAPGAKEVLARLDALRIPYGVVSNLCFSGATLERRLFSCLPGANFQFILASHDYAFRKPHKLFFDLALHKLGLPAGQDVWFCGDNPVCDVEGAARAGLRPFWVRLHGDFDAAPAPRVPCTRLRDWRGFLPLLGREARGF